MRRSLSNDAITGMLHPKTGQPIKAIGYRNDGRPIYPIMGASDDDDGGDGTDGGDGAGDDDGDDQGSGGDGDDAGSAGDQNSNDDRKNPRIKELSDENARYRNRAKKAEDEKNVALARLKEIDDADKSELDKATSRSTELEGTVESQDDTITKLRIDNAFLTSNKHKWQNPAAALRLIDLSEVEIDEDGKVTGLDKALDKLAKSDAYLLASDDDDDGDDNGTPTGQPPAPRTKGNVSRDKLVKKYPALRR